MKHGQNETDVHLQTAVELICDNDQDLYYALRAEIELDPGEYKIDRDSRIHGFILEQSSRHSELRDAIISAALGSIDWASFCDNVEEE